MFESAVLAQHVQGLQLFGDKLGLTQELLYLGRVRHASVLHEGRLEALPKEIVAFRIVFAEVQKLGVRKKTVELPYVLMGMRASEGGIMKLVLSALRP